MYQRVGVCTVGCLALFALCAAGVAVADLTQEEVDDQIAACEQQAEEEGWTFEFGDNGAAHYSMAQLCGFYLPENWKDMAPTVEFGPTRDLPESFDWRDQGGCPAVRDQGGCGACWAFSTIGPLECNIKIKDGVTVNLAEQWLLSCNLRGSNCFGGSYAHDYHMWDKDRCGQTGAVLMEDFVYVADEVPCECPYPHEYFIDSWAWIGGGDDAIKQAIMDYGPVCTSVYANLAMKLYICGIFNGCEDQPTNHAVVLVGWDDTQGDNGVWIMRNSWGPLWGEWGYMRIPYGCSRIGTNANFVNYAGDNGRVTWEYPNGIPEMIDPGVGHWIYVNVSEDTATPNPGTGRIWVSTDGGQGFISSTMTEIAPNQYKGYIPPQDCHTIVNWYVGVTVEHEGENYLVTDPLGAPNNSYETVVATNKVVVFEDDFECNKGWTVYDGASEGNWRRGDPQWVLAWNPNYGEFVVSQPADDMTPGLFGNECYCTGLLAGLCAGCNDLDGGPTILTSPMFDLTGLDNVTVGYWRWFYTENGAEDKFRCEISNDDGQNWDWLEDWTVRRKWQYIEHDPAECVTLTDQMRVRFLAQDLYDDNIVEALVDEFLVQGYECAEPATYSGDIDVDGKVDIRDLGVLLNNYGKRTSRGLTDGDIDADGVVGFSDLAELLSTYGTTRP